MRAARRGARTVRLVLVATLAGVALLLGSGIASAHAYLRSSDPAEGATVQALPGTVTLDFNETIHNVEPVVVVTGPDGRNYATGAVSVLGNAVSTAVSGGGPAGAWTMAYRVVSADGHPVEGQVRFTVAASGSGSATPTSPSSTAVGSSSSPGSAATGTAAGSTATRSTTAMSTTAGSTAAAGPTGSTAPSGTTAGSADGSAVSVSGNATSAPSPSADAGSPVVATSGGTDWWIWVAIAVAAVILVVAAVITLRKPRAD